MSLNKSDAYQDLLGKQLIAALPESKFINVFRDIFDPPEDVTPGPPRHFDGTTIYPIGSTHYVLERGGSWSFFESAAETAWREHVSRWADFARGYWTDRVPELPGVYPVRNRSKHRCKDHIFIQNGDLVLDTDSGFLRPGVRTNWAGEFWSLPYPSLPGAV